MRRFAFALLLLIASLTITIFAVSAMLSDNQMPGDLEQLSDVVVKNIQGIFTEGQRRGNDSHIFAKVGDSITVSDSFLHAVSNNLYYLGEHTYLQALIDYYTGESIGVDSFSRISLAAGVGWSAWAVLDPNFADLNECRPGETPLACEYRIIRPSVSLIMFGTNDVGYRDVVYFTADLERIIDISASMGVIPIISTIPERDGYAGRVAVYNRAIKQLAEKKAIPVWDYHGAMSTLPDFGLSGDGVHPSLPRLGYRSTLDFEGENLQAGYVIRNLTALQSLYRVWWHLSKG